MAKSTSLFLPVNTNNFSVSANLVPMPSPRTLIFTAGTEGSDVKSIIVCSDDTAVINLRLYISRGGTDHIIGTIPILVSAGYGGTVPSIDMLNSAMIPGLPVDKVGKRYLPLKNGDTLKVEPTAAMTGAKICTINVFGYDY